MRPTAQRVNIPILAPTPATLPRRKATATRLFLAGGGAIVAAAACCLVVIVSSGSGPGESQWQPDVITRPGAKEAPVLHVPPAAEPSAPRPAAEKVAIRGASPSSALRSDLEGRVASDASEELRRLWTSVADGCPADNGDAGDGAASTVPEFLVTFDAEGNEIGRSPSGNRGQSPGLGACFLARHDLRLRVPAPGREIQVSVRAPAL